MDIFKKVIAAEFPKFSVIEYSYNIDISYGIIKTATVSFLDNYSKVKFWTTELGETAEYDFGEGAVNMFRIIIKRSLAYKICTLEEELQSMQDKLKGTDTLIKRIDKL